MQASAAALSVLFNYEEKQSTSTNAELTNLEVFISRIKSNHIDQLCYKLQPRI